MQPGLCLEIGALDPIAVGFELGVVELGHSVELTRGALAGDDIDGRSFVHVEPARGESGFGFPDTCRVFAALGFGRGLPGLDRIGALLLCDLCIIATYLGLITRGRRLCIRGTDRSCDTRHSPDDAENRSYERHPYSPDRANSRRPVR